MALIIALGIAGIVYIVSALTLVCCSLYQLYGGISEKVDKIENVFEKSSFAGLIVSIFALVVLTIITFVWMFI